MPKVKQELSVDSLRHTEYYGMQRTYDDLYARSKNGEQFSTLMDIIQHKHAKGYPPGKCYYSAVGRSAVHENLRINVSLMLRLMRQPSFGYNAEYMDNRISLFSAQWGKCAVTGQDFRTLDEIHCHHKTPKENGGGDEYGNLVLILEPVHRLIHAKEAAAIARYSILLNLDQKQIAALNKLRCLAGLPEIN